MLHVTGAGMGGASSVMSVPMVCIAGLGGPRTDLQVSEVPLLNCYCAMPMLGWVVV